MTSLQNKTALITGGTKGIGLGIAERMAAEGMRIAITGRNAAEARTEASKLIKLGAADTLGLICDVRDEKSQEACVKEIMATWGQLDVVIANAGVGHFDSIESMSLEKWNEVIDTNLTGVFNTVKATVEALKASKGYLITMASLAGTNFFANGAAYNASKFGLVGFTQAVMLDLRKYGIKVTTIMPGSVATYFNGHVPNEKDDWKIQPEDIGDMVVDLLKLNPRTLPSKIEVRPSMPQ
ncbi:MAG: SDR family oxidoreductase [Saprospiraceae bacterium]|uniref:SDR family oxidoreductase n=1 Tax=Candidatus Opimibacter skivensis TaxID=2982028 RepID=A0A9D7SUS7_9BACT|nr:SDR family oxidoreductase [Candidatus Opimibacter skivensis]